MGAAGQASLREFPARCGYDGGRIGARVRQGDAFVAFRGDLDASGRLAGLVSVQWRRPGFLEGLTRYDTCDVSVDVAADGTVSGTLACRSGVGDVAGRFEFHDCGREVPEDEGLLAAPPGENP